MVGPEKIFLLKCLWIFSLSTTIHGSKINIKERKKMKVVAFDPFFYYFQKDHIAKKKLFKKCNRNYYCDQSHDAKVLHLNTFFYATLDIVLVKPAVVA